MLGLFYWLQADLGINLTFSEFSKAKRWIVFAVAILRRPRIILQLIESFYEMNEVISMNEKLSTSIVVAVAAIALGGFYWYFMDLS